MRFSKLIAKTVRLMDKEDAQEYCGGAQLFEMMERAGWIKAACRRHRLTRYDVKVLDEACDRLSRGEFPETQPLAA